MQILIAEDEEATAKALKLLLEKAMYSVDIVHNGRERDRARHRKGGRGRPWRVCFGLLPERENDDDQSCYLGNFTIITNMLQKC